LFKKGAEDAPFFLINILLTTGKLMILDELFGPPISKVKKIIRKNGKLKTVWKPASVEKSSTPQKTFFPISKERK
jgi:hypothetical protein